jgi:hypothetical protein
MRYTRIVAAFALVMLTALICACSSHVLPGAVVPQAAAGAGTAGVDRSESSTGIVALHVIVPPHPESSEKPAYVSPATQGVGAVVSQGGTHKKFFFALSPTEKYCSGGTATIALSCKLQLSVPAGKDTFVISGYAGTKPSGPLLSSATLVQSVKSGSRTVLKISMGGVVTFLQVALDDPFPPIGSKTSIPVRITAADAWGYLIVGQYAKAIAVTDSDATGITKLSATTISSSTAASKLVVAYSGKALKEPATIRVAIGSGSKPKPASAALTPGGSGIVASPSFAIASFGSNAAVITLGGPGATGPFSVSTAQDRARDAACSSFVAVTDLGGGSFAVAASGSLGACWLSASDSAGHSAAIPVLVSAYDWGYTPPSPTPPPLPTSAPFSVSTSAPMPTITPPPAGHTPQPVPVPVPSSGTVSGQVQLPVADASAVPAGTSVVSAITNTAPNALPPLLRVRPPAPFPHSASAFNVIVYLELMFSNTVGIASQPNVSFTVPSGDIVSGATYWIAVYDTTQPDLGWQLGFEGPGTVTGSTVTFVGTGVPFYFEQWQPYYFALYAQSAAQATPTPPPPAPSPTPTSTPGLTPTPSPTPGFTLGPTSISLDATGATTTLTASGGTPPYFVVSSDTSVITASPSSGDGTFTVTAGVAGTATLSVTDSLGKRATASAAVTTTVVPVH